MYWYSTFEPGSTFQTTPILTSNFHYYFNSNKKYGVYICVTVTSILYQIELAKKCFAVWNPSGKAEPYLEHGHQSSPSDSNTVTGHVRDVALPYSKYATAKIMASHRQIWRRDGHMKGLGSGSI